jgi:hypothetical protein
MRKNNFRLTFGIVLSFAVISYAVTVRPADTGQALVNPGMGWTLHFYSNIIQNYGSRLEPSDVLEDWPGLSVIYLRVPWSFLEPQEGQFNWSLFDTPAQKWIDCGKQIAIRVTCSESWMRYATPKWVQEAGAKGVDFEFGKGGKPGGPQWEPDFLDPIFLDKLEAFLAAMAQRYDGNPNVAFIDIGSFGMWGEGHTGNSTNLSDEATLNIVKRHIDLHRKYFTQTQLCISDDIAGPNRPGRHFPVTDYAFAQGVTLRDDSILVQPPPDSWFHAEMAQQFWPTMPVILEHEHYGSSKTRGAWDGQLLHKAVRDYHASYMSIHWWPRELLNENRDIINQINKQLGYRLFPQEISWPDEVSLGKPFEITIRWQNEGVAPCYIGGHATLTLKDSKGGIVSVHVDEAFNLRNVKPADNEHPGLYEQRMQAVIAMPHKDPMGTFAPAVNPSMLDVFLSVGKRDGTPVIALPLADMDNNRRYKLGLVRVMD